MEATPVVYHDRVHGEVVLPSLLAEVVRSPLFFRLDGIRQLGGCSLVYPSATHTRFEHSLGVCHLAGVLGRHLQAQRPDLVDEADVFCLQLAGLVHDLGHGPFSHTFEEYVREEEERQGTAVRPWSHEDMTISLLDALREEVPRLARECSPEDHAFVRLLVLGMGRDEPWPEGGRPPSKRFLLDVVHNRSSGLDVDKLDYLARDALAVFGATQACDVARILRAAVLVPNGEESPLLAFDESVGHSISHVFDLRARLHRQVYQHRHVLAVEGLVKDLARDHRDRLLAAARDPRAFARLVDATLLAEEREARSRLLARPWHAARLACEARLPTLPLCASCGRETEVRARFCEACGASTSDREGVWSEGFLVPPYSSEEEATADVRSRLAAGPARHLRVHIADVHRGVAVPLLDPHGRAWRDFAPPHRLVPRAKNGRLLVQRGDDDDCPSARHTRTAYCYLYGDWPPDVRSCAERSFCEWAVSQGGTVLC